MDTRRIFSCLACSLVVAGCATAKKEVAPAPAPSLASLMGDADTAIRAGRNDQALTVLAAAGAHYPGEKAPWLRMAQVHFECHDYGRAISSAQQVVARDGDDIVAHSILAASGLRVSSKALGDLTEKNHLNGSVRAEAQDLARLVRMSIGSDIIVPPPPKPPKQDKQSPQPRQERPRSPARFDPFETFR